MDNQLTHDIFYIGANDKTLDLFEGQYIIPNGISYNSYIILDDQIAILDTVDKRATQTWFSNLEQALHNRLPNYLIVLHMEPDHAANISAFLDKYPSAKIIVNAKTSKMIPQFFPNLNLDERMVLVDEQTPLSLVKHTLSFIMAPMVHWPEVMMTYETQSKILFSADAFGSFGTLDGALFFDEIQFQEEYFKEARRYYANIVGKYGLPVQNVL